LADIFAAAVESRRVPDGVAEGEGIINHKSILSNWCLWV
jgi:hypothetical protein